MNHSSTTIIRKANSTHLDELEQLYDRLNDYMAETINYPGWIKGIYPRRETALKGINENNLFIISDNEGIRGSIILNHEPERAYENANWGIQSDYSQIIVIHTLVVDPLYLSRGIASQLMGFAEQYCHSHKFQSIRLDVSINNLPAISLYEKFGYTYIDTVDLDLEYEHLKWFRLYEKLI